MQCPACQGKNLSDARFCQHCGSRLERVCGACRTANTADSCFCRRCGTRLAPAAEVAAAATTLPPHQVERKVITVLFADIKGSMALLDGMDPDAARQVIDPALHLMIAAVYRYGGFVSQSLGDGIVALFGAPMAHEDHAHRALHAALGMQQDMRALNERLMSTQGIPSLQIRVGIHTGEVVVRTIPTDEQRADYAPVGHSMGLAARIESIAMPGSIVASESTHRLTQGYFEFRSLGSVPLKGVSADIALYEVIGIGPMRSRFQVSASLGFSCFVGRTDELWHMHRALASARGGRGQIVGLIGEAGAGKSRLCHEFKRQAGSGCLLLECRSDPYGKAFAYLPLIDMLKNYLQIEVTDDGRAKLEKVAGRALALDPDLGAAIPFLLALLGVNDPSASMESMDPQIRRRRTFDALIGLVLRESQNRPVLVLMEDLHWLDAESQAFLCAFGRAIEGARVMLLVNYRPEYVARWEGSTSHCQLRLNELGRDDARSLLDSLLGPGPALAPLKQLVIDKTAGNPFFMEEYVRTLFDHGVLVRGDPVRLARPPAALEIPTTVQGVLAARIDRLQPDHKSLLHMLSVIGTASPLSLVERVTEHAPARLREMIDRLQASELVYERPNFPAVEVVFRHALTREVAYGQMVAETRRALHLRVAQAIEALYGERLEDHCVELAHHYASSDSADKAVVFLQRAAGRAMRQSVYASAIEHVNAALALLHRLDDAARRDAREVQLQAMLGSAQMAMRGFAAPEGAQAYERARALCHAGTDTGDLVRVLGGLGLLYVNRGELRLARALGEHLLELAQRSDEVLLRVAGHELLGLTLLRTGELRDCCSHLEAAAGSYDARRDGALRELLGRDPLVTALAFGALARWLLGHADQALAAVAQATRVAQSAAPPPPFSQAYAMHASAWLHVFRGEAGLALQKAGAAAEFATEHAFPSWLAHALVVRGWAWAQLGHAEEGLASIEDGLATYEATGAKVWLPLFLLWRAQAELAAGRRKQALESVDQALRSSQAMGSYWWEAELLRVKGELLLLNGAAPAQAQTWFEQARTLAGTQGAKSLELRACLSSARLIRGKGQANGRWAVARDALSALCEWFGDSIVNADLIEARELLRAGRSEPGVRQRCDTHR